MRKLVIAKSLYSVGEESITTETAVDYSKMKLGNKKTIRMFGQGLSLMIRNDLLDIRKQGSEFVLCHIPTFIKESGLHYVTEEVGKLLSLPIIELEKKSHSFEYQKTIKSARKEIVKDLLNYYGPPLFNKSVILLDDSVVTGSMLKSARRILLGSGAKKVYNYVILRITPSNPAVEDLFDIALYLKLGLEKTIRLINKESIFTNFIISFLYSLPQSERNLALNLLDTGIKSKIGEKVRSFPKNTPLARSKLRNL